MRNRLTVDQIIAFLKKSVGTVRNINFATYLINFAYEKADRLLRLFRLLYEILEKPEKIFQYLMPFLNHKKTRTQTHIFPT